MTSDIPAHERSFKRLQRLRERCVFAAASFKLLRFERVGSGERGTCAARCDVQERHNSGRRRHARVRQRGVRQGARAAPAAVLQVQGRGLLLQGVPGGRPGRSVLVRKRPPRSGARDLLDMDDHGALT